jgi:hypothetical protein
VKPRKRSGLIGSAHYELIWEAKKEVVLMNKDIAKGKVKQAKGNIKEKVGKVTIDKSQLEIPKVCPSCSNPRWDKTARNT